MRSNRKTQHKINRTKQNKGERARDKINTTHDPRHTDHRINHDSNTRVFRGRGGGFKKDRGLPRGGEAAGDPGSIVDEIRPARAELQASTFLIRCFWGGWVLPQTHPPQTHPPPSDPPTPDPPTPTWNQLQTKRISTPFTLRIHPQTNPSFAKSGF